MIEETEAKRVYRILGEVAELAMEKGWSREELAYAMAWGAGELAACAGRDDAAKEHFLALFRDRMGAAMRLKAAENAEESVWPSKWIH